MISFNRGGGGPSRPICGRWPSTTFRAVSDVPPPPFLPWYLGCSYVNICVSYGRTLTCPVAASPCCGRSADLLGERDMVCAFAGCTLYRVIICLQEHALDEAVRFQTV